MSDDLLQKQTNNQNKPKQNPYLADSAVQEIEKVILKRTKQTHLTSQGIHEAQVALQVTVFKT